MAKASNPTGNLDELPEGLEYIKLGGHFFDMIGIKTSDDVYFLADCVFGENIVKKYHISFIYNVDEFLKTLDYVENLEGKLFIPSHAEACEDLERAIELIRDAGVKVGVSIKPATPVNDISHLLEDVDMVLIMTVQPGFGGQKYISECTEKIQELKEIIDKEELDVDIQVDGGINEETLVTVMEAGANLDVAGSYVFNGNLADNVRKIEVQMEKIKSKLD